MLKNFQIVIFATAAFMTTAMAQDGAETKEASVLLGARGGITTTVLAFGGEAASDFSTRVASSSDLGVSLGVPVLFRLNKAFSLETGLGYYRLAPKMVETQNFSSNSKATYTSKSEGDFFAIPLLINLGLEKTKFRLGVSAGLMANFLVGGKKEDTEEYFVNGNRIDSRTDNGTLEQYDAMDADDKAIYKLNKSNFSVNVGGYFGFVTPKGAVIQVEGRYNVMLSPTYELNPPSSRNLSITTHSMMFSVAYLHPIKYK